ncbi:hypothetical protein VB773_21410 [Haloarculaceae archaeon H-GB2-1]|nr:hypothetical protein [Haloarculaceae archaeon H-GB11]MEA5409874.1 hypothetical protein [Haloarculaceae archaeon H-GB2-1]
MPVTRAKQLDTLYDDVRDYDLVVVPDAPLASGLNRRLDRPQLGSFAITPRRLAAGRRERAEDRSAFLELVTSTDLDWKQASYAIGNTLQCWEHQGHVDAVLNYDAYADAATETTVEQLSTLDTTSRRLSEYQIDDRKDVAVVGHDQLTTLERSILPAQYDRVDPFTDAAFDHPPFHVFNSSTAIVDAVLGVVSAENAEDVAVVADRGSEYSTLVESALEAADIPFIGGPGFADDQHHRGFVQFLRAATCGTDTRVKTIRSVLSRLGIAVDVEHNDKRLQDVEADSLPWFREFSTEIEDTTFAAALTAYERQVGTSLDAFRDELEALGIANDDITERAVDRLEFYLQSYEVPVDRDHEGSSWPTRNPRPTLTAPSSSTWVLTSRGPIPHLVARGSTATQSSPGTSRSSNSCSRTASNSTISSRTRSAAHRRHRVSTSRTSLRTTSSASATSTR